MVIRVGIFLRFPSLGEAKILKTLKIGDLKEYSMADRSKYQQKVIKRFYDNREQIDQQRLSELVTNLFLAEGKKKRATLWEKASETMLRLGVPQSRVDHVVAQADPAILAEVVKEVEGGMHHPRPKTNK